MGQDKPALARIVKRFEAAGRTPMRLVSVRDQKDGRAKLAEASAMFEQMGIQPDRATA